MTKPVEVPPFPNRLRALARAFGVSGVAIAEAMGVGKAAVSKYMKGDRKITPARAKAVTHLFNLSPDQWAHVAYDETTGAIVPMLTVPLAARRFAAARWAYWNDEMDSAADDLGVNQDLLEEIEEGSIEASQELLIKFHTTTAIPLTWFFDGKIDGVPSVLAGRIVFRDPDLGPDFGPGQRGAGRPERGPAGRNAA